MKCILCDSRFKSGEHVIRLVSARVIDPSSEHVDYTNSDLHGDVHVECLFEPPAQTQECQTSEEVEQEGSVVRTNALWFVGG